jgi:predicted RecA/RadA family phage recombinase
MQNKISNGRSIDLVPTEDVAGGSLVLFDGFVAVASTDIPAGEMGACEVEGVFSLPKEAGAIEQGAPLYFAEGVLTVTKPEDGSGFVGCAWEKADSGAGFVEVRINFGAAPEPEPAG